MLDRRPRALTTPKKLSVILELLLVPETVVEVVENFRKRVNLCYEMAGRHFHQNTYTIGKFHLLSICC